MKKKLLLSLFLFSGLFLAFNSHKEVKANDESSFISSSTTLEESSSEVISSSVVEESSSIIESSTILESTPIDTETPTEEEEFDIGVWLEETFTAEFFTNLGSIGVGLFAILKLVANNKQLTSSKILTPQEIADLVLKEINKKENNNFNAYIQPLTDLVKTSIASSKDLAKIISLMIENTPQSRLAILEIIEKMGSVERSVIEESRQQIYDEIEQEKQEKQETINELDKITQETEGRY